MGDDFVALWEKVVNVINEVALEYDKQWQVRKRVINSMLIILLIFRLVCSKNSQSYETTIDELWDSCDRLDLPLPQNGSIAPSSFCAARLKLDENIFKEINQKIIATYAHEDKWLGHRIFAVDGSKINLPRKLISSNYKLPSKNATYPQGLLSCLYQIKSQMPFDFDLVSHANERICAEHHLHTLEQNDVVIYDRGYFSYVMLHHHFDSKIHAVFRLQKNSYTVIKHIFCIEDFHAKSERGVKQEIFAHFALITMNRIFANKADVDLNQSNYPASDHKDYLQTHILKINFKNCIQVFSRSMEELLLLQTKIKRSVERVYKFIIGRNQKERPGRSYARKSMKPGPKWQPSKERKKKTQILAT